MLHETVSSRRYAATAGADSAVFKLVYIACVRLLAPALTSIASPDFAMVSLQVSGIDPAVPAALRTLAFVRYVLSFCSKVAGTWFEQRGSFQLDFLIQFEQYLDDAAEEGREPEPFQVSLVDYQKLTVADKAGCAARR